MLLRPWRNIPSRCLSSLTSTYSVPPKVAIVGGGPAGFYSAQYLLKNMPDGHVDMYEKYPVPFGLVRFGVAPDHPEVKNVIHQFTAMAKSTPYFRFFGGVTVGATLSVSELLSNYDAVILAYGSAGDRLLGIAGETGPNVLSAREFVGWYNGLPENVALNMDLSCTSAVVIGQGNVALDVARILLTPPDLLAQTDITAHALLQLRESKIRDVYVVGRRGPIQVAFTIKEFRELTKLQDVNTVLRQEDIQQLVDAAGTFPARRKRLMELMVKSGQRKLQTGDNIRNCHLRFLLSPRKIVKADNTIYAVNFQKNKLEIPTDMDSVVTSTEETEAIPCGLVIRSIGYKAEQIDKSLPFDTIKHIIKNEHGRVLTHPGLYCSGWIKRGPEGVILTTMNDAYETVELLLDDLKTGRLKWSLERKTGAEAILPLLRSRDCDPVTFSEWEAIDKEEVARGNLVGKPREKSVDVAEMIGVAKGIQLSKVLFHDALNENLDEVKENKETKSQ
ncbi:hypothetical protein RvY_17970 [Ramazzottius varieornatus]|uniref:NADPH:adrenodoxin oxidoreductase, mitochondrial n=1 Tax=Ramazzottius varieornatus TaxID=947166 RepID=A0A1D1W4R0_RAMVA|nr:hypothetical protein RvY_17970 [Ramazzottius varieornatus]